MKPLPLALVQPFPFFQPFAKNHREELDSSPKDGIMSNRSMTTTPLHQNSRIAMKLDTLKPNPLKPDTPPTFAERIGRMLGRAWRGVLRLERNACAWLTARLAAGNRPGPAAAPQARDAGHSSVCGVLGGAAAWVGSSHSLGVGTMYPK